MTYVEMSPEAQEDVRERACLIWEGAFGCDEEAWPEAKRMAVRCVALTVDRERRIVYPAHRAATG